MARDWRNSLKTDPIGPLLSSGNAAVACFARRDLLAEKVEPAGLVPGLPEVQQLLRRQQPDGSWKAKIADPLMYPPGHYYLVETFKRFRLLVQRYELDNTHGPVQKAAEYLFSFQTPEGDIRGMIANQYATYYTGLFLALLIRSGYTADPRIEKGLQWLLSMRQADGGWTIPILTGHYSRSEINTLTSRCAEPFPGDSSRPFSHNWTNMVLQAFAVHPRYRGLAEVRKSAELLKSRFFKADSYSSYRAAANWVRFRFWWPNLLTALEALLELGFTEDDPDIRLALGWFIANQQKDGLWDLETRPGKNPGAKDLNERLWLSLAICRMLKKSLGEGSALHSPQK
jgi:hypothetical protein